MFDDTPAEITFSDGKSYKIKTVPDEDKCDVFECDLCDVKKDMNGEISFCSYCINHIAIQFKYWSKK